MKKQQTVLKQGNRQLPNLYSQILSWDKQKRHHDLIRTVCIQKVYNIIKKIKPELIQYSDPSVLQPYKILHFIYFTTAARGKHRRH